MARRERRRPVPQSQIDADYSRWLQRAWAALVRYETLLEAKLASELQHEEKRLEPKYMPPLKVPLKNTNVGFFDLNNGGSWSYPKPGTGSLGKAPEIASGNKSSASSESSANRISVANTRSTARIIARYYKGFRRGSTWGQRPGAKVSTDGARIQSVVKSRYQSNRWGVAKDKLMKHLSYLEFRPRADFEKAKDRLFYSKDRSEISGVRVFEEAIDRLGNRAGYHKIILSPGDNSVNLTDYTREVMEQWQQSVGREFSWWAVNHYNTDHYHSHVVVAGKDLRGRDLEFDREMLAECRDISDRYLCRDRNFDRELDLIADIQTNQMMRRFDMADKLLDIGIGRPEQLQQILDLGLRTDDDYRKEWEALGLRKIYELGRPFEGIRQVSKDQVEFERAQSLSESQTSESDLHSQVYGAGFGEESSTDSNTGESEVREVLPEQGSAQGINNNSGQAQPGGWLQQQNTVITEPASVPFGHDVKEQDQEHSDRDDDDGMRITAKGRI